MDCRAATEWNDPLDPADPTGPTMGESIDRFVIWDKQVWPPTMRLVEAAFPGHDWGPWKRTRPKKVRAPRATKS